MTNSSKQQAAQIRSLLEEVGLKSECPTCQEGMLVIDPGVVRSPGSDAGKVVG